MPMPTPWAWVPSEWSDPYGTPAPAPVPVPPSDPNAIDYGSTQEYAAGDYYDEDLGLVNGATGQPRYPQGDAVQDTIKRTVDIAKTLGHPDAAPPAEDPLKERLIAQVAGPRSDVARIAETTGPVGTIGQIGRPVPGLATPPILGERPQPLTPPLLGEKLEADAVSGVDQPPPPDAAVGAAPMPADRPIEEIQDPVEQANAWAKLAQENPEAYADAMRRHQLAEIEQRRPREEQIMRDDWEREKAARAELDAIRARAVALQDQIEADSTQLARQHIGDRRSFGQKAAHFISAVVSGLVQGRVGGRNIGLDQMNADIDRDIEVQKQEIANAGAAISRKQGIVAQLYAQHGDLERASETARRATKEHALQQLEMEMMKFDPNGSIARQLGQQIIKGRADLAAANQKWQEHQIDRDIKAGEYGIKVADLKLRQNADQRAAAKAAGAGAAPKYLPEYYEALYGPDGKPPLAMSEKEHATWLGKRKNIKDLTKPATDKSPAQLRKEEADATEAEAKAAAAKTGYQIFNPETGEPFMKDDGTAVVEMDATKRNEANTALRSAFALRRLADKFEAIKKRAGGVVKSLGSDDAQEIATLTAMVDFGTFKFFGLGAPSEGDKGLAEGVRGGADPTSFVKNATKGFQSYANAVEQSAQDYLRQMGHKKPLKFRRAADLKNTEPSVVDEITARLIKSELVPDDLVAPLSYVSKKTETSEKGNKQAKEDLYILSAYAEQPGDVGDQARNALRQLQAKAVSPLLRDKVKEILESTPGAHERTGGAR